MNNEVGYRPIFITHTYILTGRFVNYYCMFCFIYIFNNKSKIDESSVQWDKPMSNSGLSDANIGK